MNLDSNTKTLLAFVAVAVLLYAVYCYMSPAETFKSTKAEPFDNIEHFDGMDDSDTGAQALAAKDIRVYGKNTAEGGYKTINYADGDRQNKGEWMKYFGEPIIGAAGPNDAFLPRDESNGAFAIFKGTGNKVCGSNQECSPEDLFDVDQYLPQEVNDDWFEVLPEAVSVKNRHLINIVKPIGVNTLVQSNRNSSYDIRGTPSCPKFVVSPWNQSSIEADVPYRKLY
jgi:hypothetical protein